MWLQRESPCITFNSRDPLKKRRVDIKGHSRNNCCIWDFICFPRTTANHKLQLVSQVSFLLWKQLCLMAENTLSRPSRSLHWCDWGASRPFHSLSWVSVMPFIWQLNSERLFLYLLMQPISASVDILQQVLCVFTLQSKQELKVNKDVGVQGGVETIFKRIYVMGMTSFDLHQPPLRFLLSAFHLFCLTLIDVSVFSTLPNIKTSLLLTDIIIQLGSRTPTGSLTERDEDEKSSPRASRSTVGEIKRIALAFWSGRKRLFVKFQMFDELYARTVTPKR